MIETFDLPYGKLNGISLDLMGLLAEKDEDVGTGAAAAALLLGRLLAPGVLEPPEEIRFVQGALDWASAFWAEGQC